MSQSLVSSLLYSMMSSFRTLWSNRSLPVLWLQNNKMSVKLRLNEGPQSIEGHVSLTSGGTTVCSLNASLDQWLITERKLSGMQL